MYYAIGVSVRAIPSLIDPRVSHIKYRNLYAGSAKCDAGDIYTNIIN